MRTTEAIRLLTEALGSDESLERLRDEPSIGEMVAVWQVSGDGDLIAPAWISEKVGLSAGSEWSLVAERLMTDIGEDVIAEVIADPDIRSHLIDLQ